MRARHVVPLLSLAALMAGSAWAQGPGGAGGPSPQMRQKMERFREQHKYSFQLRDTVMALGRIEQEKRVPLTAAQAGKVSAVIARVRKQPRVTQEQSKQALKELKAPLTARQLNEIAKIAKQARSRRGPGGPGGPRPGGHPPGGFGGPPPGGFGGPPPGGPGGPPPGGPGGPPPDAAKMKDFNPLAPPKAGSSPGRRGPDPLQQAISLIARKARQK